MAETRITATEADELRRWVVCEDRCEDPSMHDFYVNGGGFVWCWPKFNRLDPADKRPRFLLNRYPHNVIGAAVIVFGRGYGVRWKGSPKRKKSNAASQENR